MENRTSFINTRKIFGKYCIAEVGNHSNFFDLEKYYKAYYKKAAQFNLNKNKLMHNSKYKMPSVMRYDERSYFLINQVEKFSREAKKIETEELYASRKAHLNKIRKFNRLSLRKKIEIQSILSSIVLRKREIKKILIILAEYAREIFHNIADSNKMVFYLKLEMNSTDVSFKAFEKNDGDNIISFRLNEFALECLRFFSDKIHRCTTEKYQDFFREIDDYLDDFIFKKIAKYYESLLKQEEAEKYVNKKLVSPECVKLKVAMRDAFFCSVIQERSFQKFSQLICQLTKDILTALLKEKISLIAKKISLTSSFKNIRNNKIQYYVFKNEARYRNNQKPISIDVLKYSCDIKTLSPFDHDNFMKKIKENFDHTIKFKRVFRHYSHEIGRNRCQDYSRYIYHATSFLKFINQHEIHQRMDIYFETLTEFSLIYGGSEEDRAVVKKFCILKKEIEKNIIKLKKTAYETIGGMEREILGNPILQKIFSHVKEQVRIFKKKSCALFIEAEKNIHDFEKIKEIENEFLSIENKLNQFLEWNNVLLNTPPFSFQENRGLVLKCQNMLWKVINNNKRNRSKIKDFLKVKN